MSSAVDKDVVAGWQQVTQMSMKAQMNQSSSPDNTPKSSYESISSLPMVGYNTANVSTEKIKRSDVIVLSDEEETDGPSTGHRLVVKNGPTHQVKPPASAAQSKKVDPNSLREKLLEEERKLKVLQALKSYQNPDSSLTANGRVTGFSKTHSIATVPIQGSALNKTSAKSSALRISTLEHNRSSQSKHSIVVVPGNLKPSQHSNTSTSVTGSGMGTGISSRLQQLVDNVAVDQALPSDKNLSRLNLQLGKARSLTPPVPSLAAMQKTTKSTTSSAKPPHEIITITGPSSRTQPPPLLPSTTSQVPMTSKVKSIQVSTISSTTGTKNLAILAMNKEELSESDHQYVKQVVENSKRYRDYMLKQTHTRRSFTKQLERKILVAPYPKTFRQVWPIIPVHDSSFIANFGLEGVVDHFQSSLKSQAPKIPPKPVCNQCSCDFASAWQIRKGNSKQLLLCESCDFQNLKILQRSKLSNQLKDLLETVRIEEEQFNQDCEEARTKVIELEKQALVSLSNKPPPLTSQLTTQQKGVAQIVTSNVIKTATKTSTQLAPGALVDGNLVSSKQKSSSDQQHPVIPSILGQRLQTPELLSIDGIIKSSRKRKDSSMPSSVPLPPSKSFKPGSVLDQTLNKISQTLIHRKLDEQRQDTRLPADEEPTRMEPAPMETSENSENNSKLSASAVVEAKSTNTPESRKNRRKGTPKHKRLLSASSVTSE